MIETLEHLTVNQFVDLVCGNTGVLHGKHEIVSDSRLAIAMRNIVFEYKEIADRTGARSFLGRVEDLIKAKIEVIAFRMCNSLVEMSHYDRAREVMAEYGINIRAITDKRVAVEVRSRLERARSTVRKIESENSAGGGEVAHVRRMFDEQTAALMAYFRFQIDTAVMKATVYANLIARHNREIKAKATALSKGKV